MPINYTGKPFDTILENEYERWDGDIEYRALKQFCEYLDKIYIAPILNKSEEMTRKQAIQQLASKKASDYVLGIRNLEEDIINGNTVLFELTNLELEEMYFNELNKKITIE